MQTLIKIGLNPAELWPKPFLLGQLLFVFSCPLGQLLAGPSIRKPRYNDLEDIEGIHKHTPFQQRARDGPARLRGNFKKYNQTIILRILPILAKLGQKTIKNEQKQSILTQGGQKTIKIY